MTCEVLASIELAAISDPSLRFISSQEILTKAPETTRNSTHPFHIPCHQSGGVNFIVPDGLFGLEYLIDEKKSYRFFALEVDRETMPIVRSRKDQTSYLSKLTTYREAIALETHKSHLRLPNFLVLTVTITERHKANMMSAFSAVTGTSTAFLFKSVTCDVAGGISQADPSILFEPWERIGISPQRIAGHQRDC
jgi:hypothetical protein